MPNEGGNPGRYHSGVGPTARTIEAIKDRGKEMVLDEACRTRSKLFSSEFSSSKLNAATSATARSSFKGYTISTVVLWNVLAVSSILQLTKASATFWVVHRMYGT